MTADQENLLLNRMAKCGFRTYSQLCDKIGMGLASFSKRKDGKIHWKDTEIKTISAVLKLNPKETRDIFLV